MSNRIGDGLSVYRGCRPIVDAEYDYESDHPITETIIWALADAADADPTDIPPLFDHTDPDAINALFDRSHDVVAEGDTILSFQVDTWNVFVRSDGRIRVCDPTQPVDPEPVFESTVA